MNNSKEYLKDEGSKSQAVIAGAIAGLTARFVIAPLDVIKIRLQLQTQPTKGFISEGAQNQSPHKTIGACLTFRHLIQNEGISSLWKGNIPAELMYLSYSSIQFVTYRTITLALQRNLGDNQLTSTTESFIAGACAGAISTSVTYPLDLLRTRLAAQGTNKIYRNFLHSVRDIYRSEGSSGFFRGVGAGVGQIIPYMGIFFSTYEALRLRMRGLNLPFGTRDASAGIIASLVAKTIVFPFDLIRKKLQVQGPTRSRYVHKNIPVYKGTIKTLIKIFKMEGPRGLYRGLIVSLLKAAPSGAVTMWTYEKALHILMNMDAATVIS